MPILGEKKYNFKLKKYSVDDGKALNASRYNLLIFIDKLDFGDTAKNIVDIANGLIKRNVDVIILASCIRGHQRLEADIKVMTLGILHNKLMPFFMKVVRVGNICQTNKVDIILTASNECACIANSVAKKWNIKHVTFINEIWNIKDVFCRKQYEIMLKSDLMVLPSLYMCDYILDNYDDVNHKKMKLVGSGIDINMFNIDNVSKGRKMEATKYLGEPVIGKNIFLCPNKFNNKKGQMVLLDAVARLIDGGTKNFICVLIGDFAGSQNYRHVLVEKIRQLGIQRYVLLLNTFDDMPALYSLSYAVLSLSKSGEASTRIIAEAGAMYKPAIVTYVGGLQDYIVNEKSGYIVNPDNITDICNAMKKILLQSEEQYQDMCDFAHQYALEYFNVCNTIDEMDNALFHLTK